MYITRYQNASNMVREFHQVFGLPVYPDAPTTLDELRAELIREEAKEAADAIMSGSRTHMAKKLADLIIVTHGAALTFGLDLDGAVEAVHRSNMTKLVNGFPVLRADGKVLKGEDYQVPNMLPFVLP